jgi:hypothetical protein
LVPLDVMAIGGWPETRSVTDVGLQPAVSAYRTENTKVVVGLPEEGVARPELRVDWCDAPLQLAAITGVATVTSAPTDSARATARLPPAVTNRFTRALRIKNRWSQADSPTVCVDRTAGLFERPWP